MSTQPTPDALCAAEIAGKPYTVIPFHPCNDEARARGDIAGWDVADKSGVRVECFDQKDDAQDRCDELNEQGEDAP